VVAGDSLTLRKKWLIFNQSWRGNGIDTVKDTDKASTCCLSKRDGRRPYLETQHDAIQQVSH
jgi:hypothetical protein